ncbi:hypothetical protein BgAZ_305690 [Babesia gibsoni]|uniref:RRM domain-containing protein n=1 Tax=Babesia gibsoni TaxID=33632 RepID=A0AAD8LQJ4_BABGI|nr:hypothetical protein BgAZ_305690 [Babesia gibsoni]
MIQETGFDHGSTVIIGGFPSRTTIDDCRAFASWFSPVIHVEEIPYNEDTKSFAVVFATTAHVESLLKYKDVAYGHHQLYIAPLEDPESVWNTVGDIISNANTTPILQLAQDGLTGAFSQLNFGWGGYLGN